VNSLQPAGINKGADVVDERRLVVATVGHIGPAMPAPGERENAKVSR
jgi:hypothetical protein